MLLQLWKPWGGINKLKKNLNAFVTSFLFAVNDTLYLECKNLNESFYNKFLQNKKKSSIRTINWKILLNIYQAPETRKINTKK